MRKVLSVLLLLLTLLSVNSNYNVSAFESVSEANFEHQFQDVKRAELPDLPIEH